MAGSGYGLGGAGLAGAGLQQKREAMGALGRVAEQEQQRNITNEQNKMAAKAGNMQLGTTLGGLAGWQLGASAGSVGGPLGALIGGVVGAIGASLF